MSNIENIVDTLENKISKVLHKYDVLKQKNAQLSQQILEQQHTLSSLEQDITSWSEKYETLKIANSMLGSDENKRETKLKINALIREIDHCIGQLSK